MRFARGMSRTALSPCVVRGERIPRPSPAGCAECTCVSGRGGVSRVGSGGFSGVVSVGEGCGVSGGVGRMVGV